MSHYSRCLVMLAFPICTICAVAQSAPVERSSEAALAAEAEVAIVADLKNMVQRNDDLAVDEKLRTGGRGEWSKRATSVLLVQRAAAVCGWLQNENDYGRAIRFAKQVLQKLGKLNESTDDDRVERLYWEAWLEGKVLDQKARAVELLKQAERLAPKDDRVINLQLELVAALAEFGR